MNLLAAALATVLLLLTPLAHGSPVDPSTPGFWDNGDFDDVILFLTLDFHPLDPGPRPFIHASHTTSERPIELTTGLAPQHFCDRGTPRAPPAR